MAGIKNGGNVSKAREWPKWLRGSDPGPEIVTLCADCERNVRRKARLKRSCGDDRLPPQMVRVAYVTVPIEDNGPIIIDVMDADRSDYFSTYGEVLLGGRSK